VRPDFDTEQYKISPLNDQELSLSMRSRENQILQDGGRQYRFTIYFGPQDLSILRSYPIDIHEIMKFSNWGLLDMIAKGLYLFLNFLHRFVPNWGLCIVFVGVIIYGITYPLNLKSLSSMKKMQALQPKIAKLKEQYKNNPQKLSKEQMELFKEHKVNPMGGCLPMIFQMPVFIGFYQVLWRSIFFKGAKFLWIQDLSEPDRLLLFPFTVPFIGNELNILPLIMGIVMVFQQRFSSRNMTMADPAQASQQKMMMIFLPVMMIFIFYKAASGLTLYFTLFYLLTTFTQWKMSKVT
jgi:YidC/Oxa1 family membrane protein insertase